MKDMIISHMNKDHQMALEDYLVVYKKVDPSELANVQIKDIDTQQLVLIYGDDGNQKEAIITFEPAMKGLQESRSRLVHMAKESAEARGLSHVKIKDYVSPLTIIDSFVFSMVVIMVSLGFFKEFYLKKFPNYSLDIEALSYYSYYLSYAVLLTHGFELVFVLLPQLKKYRVPSGAAFKWYLDCLLLGYFTIARFNTLKPQKK